MNKQEMYERAFRGVMGQGGPGVSRGVCTYVTPPGDKELRCSVGHIVTDATVYRMTHLDHAVEWALTRVEPLMTREDVHKFMWDLRDVHDKAFERCRVWNETKRIFEHDNARFLELFKGKMIDFARAHGLTVPPEFAT